MTWTGCERSARSSPVAGRRAPRSPAEPGLAGDGSGLAVPLVARLEVDHCRLQQTAPGGDVRAAAQQSPALALGHATPDPELHAVVQGVGQALGADGATQADALRAVLRGALHEQRVRCVIAARGVR